MIFSFFRLGAPGRPLYPPKRWAQATFSALGRKAACFQKNLAFAKKHGKAKEITQTVKFQENHTFSLKAGNMAYAHAIS